MIQIGSHWCVSNRFYEQYTAIYQRAIINGSFPSFNKPDHEQLMKAEVSAMNGQVRTSRDEDTRLLIYEYSGKRIARIPMIGAITKHGDLCSYGATDLASMFYAAEQSKDIDAILLFADGPGGQVSGMTELSMAINSAKKVKPVVSFVDETAASAHYWGISQSSQIVLNENEYTQVGSIGVLCMVINQCEMLKKEGVEIKVMRAEQSGDKAKLNPYEEWDKEALEEQQQQLNQIAEDFHSAVKQGRGNRLKDDSLLTGKMYSKEDAIKYGLADYTGNLLGAIDLAYKLSN